MLPNVTLLALCTEDERTVSHLSRSICMATCKLIDVLLYTHKHISVDNERENLIYQSKGLLFIVPQ